MKMKMKMKMDQFQLRPCKRGEKEESHSWLSSVSEEILIEILIRLPTIRSLHRCKPVCKRWNSIISTPHFIFRCITHHRSKIEESRVKKDSFFSLTSLFTLVFQCSLHYPPKYPIISLSTHPLMMMQKKKMMKRKKMKSTNNGGRRRLRLRPTLEDDDEEEEEEIVSRGLDLGFLPPPPPLPPAAAGGGGDGLRLEASWHDLLLVSCYGVHYYLVNPLTKQWDALPLAPSSFVHRPNIPCTAAFLGLSDFDSNSNSSSSTFNCLTRFKVIRLPYIPTHWIEIEGSFSIPGSLRCDDSESSVHIYCSESKQWTEYLVDWYPFRLTQFLGHMPIVSHNGMLHWLNDRSLVSLDPFAIDYDVDVVMEDDGVRSQVPHQLRLSRTLDLPRDEDEGDEDGNHGNWNPMSPQVGVSGPHLYVITRRHDVVRIWELEEEGSNVGAVWHLVHRVRDSEVPLIRSLPTFFLAFHPHDRDVVFLLRANSVCQINLSTRKSKTFQQSKHYGNLCDLSRAVPLLLHHWFPTSLPFSLPPVTSRHQS